MNDPFSSEVAGEVPLERAPLARVLAQVRFGDVLKIVDADFIAEFQERIRKEYPNTNKEQTSSISIGPSGPQSVEHGQVWRFKNLEETWRVSLETNFVALETRNYVSRTDFMERLERLVSSVQDCFEPSFATRVGVRYVDRVENLEFRRIRDLVRAEMLGIVKSNAFDHVQHTMSEAACVVPEGQLNARWGVLPAGGTHDPSVMDPASDKSWVLDIDAFRDFAGPHAEFDAKELTNTARGLAARAYTFFRWSITPEFDKAYGGGA